MGLHQGRIENAEYTGKLLEGDVGIGLQGCEMAVGAEFLLREVGGVWSNESAQLAPSGNDVKQFVVHRRNQHLLQLGAQVRHFLQQGVGAAVEEKRRCHLVPDGYDVILQFVDMAADSPGSFPVNLLQGG